MRVKMLAMLGAAALALTGPGGVPTNAQTAPAASASQTGELVRRYAAEGKVAGLAVAYARGDAPAVTSYAGRIADESDAPAVDGATLWRIYSMTKPVTGIAAMILVEEGKLGLDQPIADFVPAFRNMKVLIDPAKGLESRPATVPITVRHLLTHTAGLGYTVVTKGPLLDEYNRLGINPATVNTAMESGFRAARPASLEAFADRVASLPLIAEPGSKWSYSISLDVLGRVIEVASGMPFDAFLQKRIFDPLKMKSTYFTVPASETSRFASNYYFVGQNRVAIDPGATSVWLAPPSFPYGGSGLVSSTADYDRFLHMLINEGSLDGARILNPATARLAMSNLVPPGADTTALQAISDLDGAMGFGAGGSVYLEDGPGGAGKGTYGWGGAAGTIGWVDPKNRIRGTLMVNYFPAEHWPLRTEITRAIYADLKR